MTVAASHVVKPLIWSPLGDQSGDDETDEW